MEDQLYVPRNELSTLHILSHRSVIITLLSSCYQPYFIDEGKEGLPWWCSG